MKNLFDDLQHGSKVEVIESLLQAENVRIERIVSNGQASPPGYWYDQAEDEWVAVLSGSAALLIEGETEPRVLRAGDHVHLPARVRHRVESTSASEPTIWLAVHLR